MVTADQIHRHTTEHIATRPSWNCRVCGSAWPCGWARQALSVDLDKVRLAMYMWASLEEAALDLHQPMRDIFDRFIAWTR